MIPARRRACAALLAATGAPGLAGCTVLARPTPIPMELILDDRACGPQAPVLLVLLPGANMSPAEMQREGMVEAVRQAGVKADVLIAGAGLEYIFDRSVMSRLSSDVFEPFAARGYRRFWLAGISLGGFVAMGYAQQHPGRVEGIFALAPYLGKRQTVQAVQQAASPQAWARGNAAVDGDIDDRLWRWLAEPPPGAPQLHLGYGADDRFAPAHRTLARLLPAERVQVVPGGHDWPPWRRLWTEWLARAPLPRACAA